MPKRNESEAHEQALSESTAVTGGSHWPIGFRKHAQAVDLPIDDRLKVRIGRSIANTLTNAVSGFHTFRHVMLDCRETLRRQGWCDQQIGDRLTQIIEDVCRAKGLGETSIVSGQPRWKELSDRMREVIDEQHRD